MSGFVARVGFRRAFLVAIALATWALFAQDQPQPARFTSAVDMALVDLFPISRSGLPVTDLRGTEVTVKLDGRPRPVRFLQLVRVAESAPAPTQAGQPASDLPLPYGTNAPPPEGRSLVIVIDDESFRPGWERPLRTSLEELIKTLGPIDRVALATMPHGGWKMDFTSNHDEILAALDRVQGLAPPSLVSTDVACRSKFTLEGLTTLFSGLRPGNGPTTVLFISSGMFGPRRGDTLSNARVTANARMPSSNSCDAITTSDFDKVGEAAAGARARLYVIQPDDVSVGGGVAITAAAGMSRPINLREGLEYLTSVTGAEHLSLAVTQNPLSRIVRETSAYYVVGFQLEPQDSNGAPHAFDVRIARDGVTTRVQPSFVMSKGMRTRSSLGAGTPKEMLREATVFRGVPLRASAFVSRHVDDRTFKVIAIAEPVEPNVPLVSAAVALFDSTGHLAAQWTATDADLKLPPLAAVLEAPAGAYRLRVAAVDQAGRGGTADSDVVVELAPAGPLKLSSLVLGLVREGLFTPKLEFGNEAVAVSSFEIYGGTPGAQITAMLEVAPTLNGPAILQMPLVIESTGSPDRFVATGAVPIAALAPGDYIVRAIVGLQDQASGRVVRTLRKRLP